MKKQVKAEEPPALPKKEEKLFSGQFLGMMASYAYETLHQALKTGKVSEDAIQLLEDLYLLHGIREIFAREKEVLFIWNSEACALVADISLRVPKLGGSFVSATGDRIVEVADS